MIIQVIEVPVTTPTGKQTTHYRVKLECNQCKRHYLGAAHYTAILKKEIHFCSRTCVSHAHKKNNVLDKKIRQTSLARYGTEHHTQSDVVETKRRHTCEERYGDISPMKNSDVVNRRKARWLAEYGVEHTSKLPSTIEKMHKTNLARYGHKSALGNDEIKSKVDWVAHAKRAHETMKRNGTYRKSKPEDLLYVILCTQYGADDIERQVYVPGTPKQWSFDFLIRSSGAYVQLDGVYWHGLDRPLEEHRQSMNPRSNSIVKKYETDRAQELWFVEHKLHLLRITDDAIVTYDDALPLTSVAYFDSTRHF